MLLQCGTARPAVLSSGAEPNSAVLCLMVSNNVLLPCLNQNDNFICVQHSSSTTWNRPRAITMATSHLMTGRYIPHFGLNSLIFMLSFSEMFPYFASSWKWYRVTFLMGKESRLFRWFFQYSVICHSSKYIRLALTDFNKNRLFHRNCMWLQLSQILKTFTKGNARKFTVCFPFYPHVDIIKIEKHLLSFECTQVTWAFVLCACAIVKL